MIENAPLTPDLTIPSTPGIYPGLPDVAYRLINALSKSDADKWVRGGELKESRNLLIGSLFHSIVLEGKEVTLERFAFHDTDFRAGTKKAEAIQAEHPGKIVMKPQEKEKVNDMLDSFYSNATIMRYLDEEGENEVALIGHLPKASPSQDAYPTKVKAKLDAIRGLLLDVKTTSCTNDAEFDGSVTRFGYDRQGSWYADLHEALTGEARHSSVSRLSADAR